MRSLCLGVCGIDGQLKLLSQEITVLPPLGLPFIHISIVMEFPLLPNGGYPSKIGHRPLDGVLSANKWILSVNTQGNPELESSCWRRELHPAAFLFPAEI